MSTIPPSVTPTIPCPAADPTRPTLPSIEVSVMRRNRTALANEIMKHEQALARAQRQLTPWKEYVEHWAELVICRSLMRNLKSIFY
jgi:hypothetical protein